MNISTPFGVITVTLAADNDGTITIGRNEFDVTVKLRELAQEAASVGAGADAVHTTLQSVTSEFGSR